MVFYFVRSKRVAIKPKINISIFSGALSLTFSNIGNDFLLEKWLPL